MRRTRWRRRGTVRHTTGALVLIAVALGALVALSPTAWREAQRMARGPSMSSKRPSGRSRSGRRAGSLTARVRCAMRLAREARGRRSRGRRGSSTATPSRCVGRGCACTVSTRRRARSTAGPGAGTGTVGARRRGRSAEELAGARLRARSAIGTVTDGSSRCAVPQARTSTRGWWPRVGLLRTASTHAATWSRSCGRRRRSAASGGAWYNTEHRHAGIAMLTPHDVHFGRAGRVLEQRARTLHLAWSRHPERFVHGTPKPQPLPQQVWINLPAAASTPRPAQ